MVNPYREHMDRIQALVKQVTRDHMYTTRPETQYGNDPNYGTNFVVASGGEAFDTDLEERLKNLMTSLTGEPDPEIVAPAPPQPQDDTEIEEDPEDVPETEEEVDEPSTEDL